MNGTPAASIDRDARRLRRLAIAASKPGVDGTREATRARTEARAELEAIAG